MKPTAFKKQLCAHGFSFQHDPSYGDRFTRDVRGKKQHVSRDSVRGSAWRLLLAVGDVPLVWPAWDPRKDKSDSWIEAESPWFRYATDLDPSDSLDAQIDNRESALQKCFNWLITVGFEWLDGPHARSRDEWRSMHNILKKWPPQQG
jgi:hypothetical protein